MDLTFLFPAYENAIVMPAIRQLVISRSPFHSLNPRLLDSVTGLGRDQVVLSTVSDGDKGTRQTIQIAKRLVAEGLRDPAVHELALSFCQNYDAQPYDENAELQAIFQGVLDNFDYRKHTVGAQSLQPVSGILRTRAGDCAELNLILLPSLLGTIGYPTRAVAIKADSSRPEEFSHVYIEAMTSDGDWIPLEVARQGTQFGIAPDRAWQREEFDLTPEGGAMNGYGMRGLGVVIRRPKSRFPARGLGDATADLQASLAAAPSILGGVAQVVQATNPPVNPYAATGTGLSASVGGSSVWIVAGVLVVIGIALAVRGKH
jgi:hypothetical protein